MGRGWPSVVAIGTILVLSVAASRAAADLPKAPEGLAPSELADFEVLARQTAHRAFWPDWGGRHVPDASAAGPDLLLAHVRLARAAKGTFPWARLVDEETFRRFVLPYRMTTERLADWRSAFWDHAELRSLVDGSAAEFEKASTDAERSRVFRSMVHALNTGWVGRNVPYAPRGMPDLNPLEAIARATGRCTDQTNTLIALLRTFGIAATGVRVVWWPEAEDNHTWTAVYDPVAREWLDVDSGQAGSAEDPAYFRRFVRDPAKRVAKVFWVAPGLETAGADHPLALEEGEAFPPGVEKYLVAKPMEDRTERYADVADLRRDGVPAGAMIWLSVWNSGAWRPVTGARATSAGAVTFRNVGCGVRYRLLTWRAEAPAYCSDVLVVRPAGSVDVTPPDPADEAALLGLVAVRRMDTGDLAGAKDALLRAIAVRPGSPNALYDLACVHARMGEKAQALDRLEQAVSSGWKNLAHMRNDPDLASLHDDPRFRRLLGP